MKNVYTSIDDEISATANVIFIESMKMAMIEKEDIEKALINTSTPILSERSMYSTDKIKS